MYIRLHCLPQQCVLFVRSLKFLDWRKTPCQPWNALEQMPVNFANKICDYIIKLQEETARENFYNWLEVGKIVTEPRFKLTPLITLSGKASSLTKSLYKQECE